MQINEVCQKTGLTKKAIEYYQLKNIITPEIKSNGYREFSEKEVEKLNKVALLRKFELSIDQIRKVLESKNPEQTLYSIKEEKQIEIDTKNERLKLLDDLIQGSNPDYIKKKLETLEKHATIKEKLLQAFPGFYGRFISLHFGRFLEDTIITEEQEEVYHFIVGFLDQMEAPSFPEEVQKQIEEVFEFWTDERIVEVERAKEEAIDDVDTFWEKNKEMLEEYSKFKLSKEYENSLMGQILKAFRSFGEASGYYDEFIPAMRKLSPSYSQYYKKLTIANDKFIEKMPEANNWYKQKNKSYPI